MNEKQEMILRKLLWINHGCSFPALYGDDGEMQCHTCGVDFKRFTPEQIEERFEKIIEARLKLPEVKAKITKMLIKETEDVIPRTLNEAIMILSKTNTQDFKDWLQKSETYALAISHLNLGMDLRNKWNLWQDNELVHWFNEQGIKHADDMSSIILTSLHRKRNDKPIYLRKQIKKYREYWKRNNPEML